MSPTGGERSYYNWNSRRNHLSTCDTPNPPVERLYTAVLQYMLDKILTEKNPERILALVTKSQTDTTLVVEDELRNVNLEIENIKSARRNLLKLVEDGKGVQGDISERLSEIRETLVRLESNAMEARAKVCNEQALISDPEKETAYSQNLKTYLRGTNRDLTKAILGELIEQVRVLRGEEHRNVDHPVPRSDPSKRMDQENRRSRTTARGQSALFRHSCASRNYGFLAALHQL